MSSRSEDLRIDMDEDASHREKRNFNEPHEGKKIFKYVISPNMQYIVTLSIEDRSIVGWAITEELELEFDKSINFEELKNITVLEGVVDLIGVTNCKQIILNIFKSDTYGFEIIDITTKSRQELNAQGLKGYFNEFNDSATFLENGNLIIVKRYPTFWAYIFSKFNGKPQWTCENIIKLKDFHRSFIFKNGKLLLVFDIPFVIMQWSLKTLEFKMQYILNWNLSEYRYSLKLEMNDNNKLLTVASHESDEGTLIYVYSMESGTIVAHNSFKENLHNFCFIGPYLFFFGSQCSTEIYNSYLLDSHTLKPQETKDFLHIYSPKYENYKEYKIISDYIIKQDINYLSIQRLSCNEYWKSYLQVQKCHVSDSFFNIKEIKQFVQDALKKCESGQNLIQNYSNEPKKLSYGESYTWIIKTSLDRIGLKNYHKRILKATIGEELTEKEFLEYHDKEDNYILENKLLENGDIILADPNGIQIYTINAENKALYLVYKWSDGYKKESETAQQSIKRNLIAFNFLIEKIDKSNFKYLPSPTYINIDDFINNRLAVKLYGKEQFYQLAQNEYKAGIEQLYNKCFEYSFSMFKNGALYDFILFTSQIALALIKLEEFNKNLKVTEKFLSKINLLISKNYYNSINNDSTLSHLQHRGIYDNSLSIISLFDYLTFWISEQRSLLKNKYPKIYKVLESPYLFYSLYFTNYSQKTVSLMIPLMNFATYPKDYSYFE
ncbi:transient receptor potential cation channel subfamily a member 1-like [Gigaspora margarita]|uniref:Transient receptor potential cation channel subfamily a member 1-like n=1 Tax=Gigaspora margarita TaxID=4874 RepID=A0A8H4B0Y4_GIGMA|nr:transient receptor potential cation channel subfamily a member 1-like [Gigaspora margarita]